jgi:hypothetical protein
LAISFGLVLLFTGSVTFAGSIDDVRVTVNDDHTVQVNFTGSWDANQPTPNGAWTKIYFLGQNGQEEIVAQLYYPGGQFTTDAATRIFSGTDCTMDVLDSRTYSVFTRVTSGNMTIAETTTTVTVP